MTFVLEADGARGYEFVVAEAGRRVITERRTYVIEQPEYGRFRARPATDWDNDPSSSLDTVIALIHRPRERAA